jgi:hypothetical protein
MSCPAAMVGYDEAILTIATAHNISWLPWAWRGPNTAPYAYNNRTCEDVNGRGLSSPVRWGRRSPCSSHQAHPRFQLRPFC